MEWNKDKIFLLIDSFRKHTALWDLANPDYKNRQLKNEAWKHIAGIIGTNEKEVDKKMKNLVTQFQRELRKCRRTSSGTYKYSSKWFAFEKLMFIRARDRSQWKSYDSGVFSNTERHHPSEYATYYEDKGKHSLKYATGDSNSDTSLPSIVVHNQDTNIQDLINFLVSELLSPNIIDSPSFIEFLRGLEPRFTMPSASYLMDYHMRPMLDKMKNDNSILFRNQSGICMTVDAVSFKESQTYAIVSANFITEKWKKCSKVVSWCKILSPTLECLVNVYEEAVESLDLSNTIICIVSSSLQAEAVSQLTLNTDYSSTRANDVLTPVEFNFSNNPFRSKVILSCFAYILQETVKDVLMESKNFQQLLTSASLHERVFISEDAQACDIFGESSMSVVEEDHSSSLLQKIKQLRGAFSNKEDLPIGIIPQGWEPDDLRNFIEIFEAYEDAFERLSDQGITCSQVIPIIKGLRHQLQKQFRNAKTPLPRSLLDSLNLNFSNVESTEEYQLATYLDPRFKAVWCSDLEQMAIERYITKEVQNIPSSNIWTVAPKPEPNKRPKLFSFMADSSRRDEPDVCQKVKEEARRYTSSPCRELDSDPLCYWKEMEMELPLLAAVARRFLCLVSSMKSMRSIFGHAEGTVLNAINMPSEQFELMIGLRMNTNEKTYKKNVSIFRYTIYGILILY